MRRDFAKPTEAWKWLAARREAISLRKSVAAGAEKDAKADQRKWISGKETSRYLVPIPALPDIACSVSYPESGFNYPDPVLDPSG